MLKANCKVLALWLLQAGLLLALNPAASDNKVGNLALKSAEAQLVEALQQHHADFIAKRSQVFGKFSELVTRPKLKPMIIEFPEWVEPDGNWKQRICATVFWVGEQPTQNNPVPNDKSAWDTQWMRNFGGYDDPQNRNGYLPAGFVPRLNPFYCALPYNDIASNGFHRPEAGKVIPWYNQAYSGRGVSVCKNRWLAIHYKGKVCYASWQDVGPFHVDHWQYVFGNERPRPNLNGHFAGLDISPAVRDYLGIKGGVAIVDWKFVEAREIPSGPWLNWSAQTARQ